MITMGIDIGSTSTETVLLDVNDHILAKNIIRTGANGLAAAERSTNMALHNAGLSKKDISYTVSTGYGRFNVPFSDKQVTEITCHAIGAYSLFPDTKTVLDIGGQDSKAISLNGSGETLDFVMNDKCSAGTGRFLEVMAQVLEVKIEDLGELSLSSQEKLSISSFCTVFAESEVISLLAKGCKRENIAQGIHYAMVERALILLNKVRIREPLTLTGGVIKNIGIANAIKNNLNIKLNIPEDPQIVGALGAAIIARHYVIKNNEHSG